MLKNEHPRKIVAILFFPFLHSEINRGVHMLVLLLSQMTENTVFHFAVQMKRKSMIPVRDEYLELFDIEIHAEDTEKQIEFKKTCATELKWCRDHLSEIERFAKNLYEIVCSDVAFGKRSICPHYGALEKECNKGKKLPKRSVQKQNKRNQRKSKRHG